MDIRWITDPLYEEESISYHHLFVVPNCCDEAQATGAIILRCSEDGTPHWELELSSRRWVPPFRFGRKHPEFCPFCGQKLPKPEPRPNPRQPIHRSEDGYYCVTCKRRNQTCTCWPPEENWMIPEKDSE